MPDNIIEKKVEAYVVYGMDMMGNPDFLVSHHNKEEAIKIAKEYPSYKKYELRTRISVTTLETITID